MCQISKQGSQTLFSAYDGSFALGFRILCILFFTKRDRLRENPAYRIGAQLAQCVFLVLFGRELSKVQILSYLRKMALLTVTVVYGGYIGEGYQGEISLYLQAPPSTMSGHLPYTEPVAKDDN